MEQAKNYLKRFSVDIGGHIIATFETEAESLAFIDSRWWCPISSIYDHEKNEVIYTEVNL